MSRLFFLFFCCLNFTLFALPPPYDSVQVRTFVDHGWFQNQNELHHVIKENNVKTVVEIGCWLGQSTMFIARLLPSDGLVFAVDHWQGSSEHQPGNSAWHPCLPYLYEQFLSNVIHAQLTHKIIPMRMESLEAVKRINTTPDLIYIDAGHDTESAYNDLVAWYPFVKEAGIFCGDDWLCDTVRIAVIRFAQENNLLIYANGNFWRLLKA